MEDRSKACKHYSQATEDIRNDRLMSIMDLVGELDIAFMTWKRAFSSPETCSLITIRKFKKFVEDHNKKKYEYSVLKDSNGTING